MNSRLCELYNHQLQASINYLNQFSYNWICDDYRYKVHILQSLINNELDNINSKNNTIIKQSFNYNSQLSTSKYIGYTQTYTSKGMHLSILEWIQ